MAPLFEERSRSPCLHSVVQILAVARGLPESLEGCLPGKTVPVSDTNGSASLVIFFAVGQTD